MPAGLTSTDGMFTVREAAWHNLGVTFEDYPTRAEAQAIAHPWEPLRDDIYRNVPVYLTDEDGNVLKDESGKPMPMLDGDGNIITEQKLITGFYANVRSDNGAELGVVSEKYTTVTNTELWDIAETIEQSGKDVMFETGGSLRGGAQVWALVRLAEPLVVKGDKRGETIPYFALQNSHDGTGSFRGQATMTRIVCMNTAQAADMDSRARGTEFMFKHTKNVSDRIAQAQTALAGWRQALTDWQEQAEYLITIPITNAGVQAFLEKYIPKPPAHLVSEKVLQNVDEDRQKWLNGYRSVTGEGIENTVYGVIQASTEFANWQKKAFNAESRFRRTFLSRDKLVSDAVSLALDAAGYDGTSTTAKALVTV